MKRIISICALVSALSVSDGCASAEKQAPVKITTIMDNDFISGTFNIKLFYLKEKKVLDPAELGRLCYKAEIEGSKYTEPHLMFGYDFNNDKILDSLLIYDKENKLVDVGLNTESAVYDALRERFKDRLIPRGD